MIKRYNHLFPKIFNTYYEPFLGSGAIYFYLNPTKAVLSDINEDLINTYKSIKSDWGKVYSILCKHHIKHDEKYYYLLRSAKCKNKFDSAARFIYLNRTCWNALYRVNKDGLFNVPIGSKDNVIFDHDNFLEISKQLKKATIYCKDFETIINKSVSSDFIFVDPPYITDTNKNGFIKYNDLLFNWDDQLRLYNCLVNAKKRGVHILFTNTFHKSIRKLYENEFYIVPVKRQGILASKSENRKEIKELIIRSYNDGYQRS